MRLTVSSPSAVNPALPLISQYLKVLFIRILAIPADWNDTSNPESLSNCRVLTLRTSEANSVSPVSDVC